MPDKRQVEKMFEHIKSEYVGRPNELSPAHIVRLLHSRHPNDRHMLDSQDKNKVIAPALLKFEQQIQQLEALRKECGDKHLKHELNDTIERYTKYYKEISEHLGA